MLKGQHSYISSPKGTIFLDNFTSQKYIRETFFNKGGCNIYCKKNYCLQLIANFENCTLLLQVIV